MTRWALGQPVTLDTTITNAAGALVDPTDITLTIQKPDGTNLPTYDYNPGAIFRDSIGAFHCDIPPSDLATLGHYQYVWITTGSGAGVGVGNLDVFNPFEISVLSMEDAKAALDIDTNSTIYDTLIHSWLDAITALIERVIGGPVVTRTITERVAATDDGKALILRKRPVTGVTSVTSETSGTAVAITDIEWDPNANIARRKLGWPFIVDVFAVVWPPVFNVVYTAGLGTSVPPTITAAAVIILQHLWEVQRGPASRPSSGGNETIRVYGMGFAVPNRAYELLAPYMTEAHI